MTNPQTTDETINSCIRIVRDIFSPAYRVQGPDPVNAIRRHEVRMAVDRMEALREGRI